MKTTITTLSKILAAAVLLASAGLAQAAGSATADIAVSATIVAKCTISTTAVAFGDYDPVTGSNVTTAGSVIVGCTKGSTGLWIGLGTGSHATTGRNMLGGTSGDLLAYSLVKPTGNTVGAACPAFGAGAAWENTSATALNLEDSPGKATRTYKVCGEIASGQDKAVDTYSDTVIATINF